MPETLGAVQRTTGPPFWGRTAIAVKLVWLCVNPSTATSMPSTIWRPLRVDE